MFASLSAYNLTSVPPREEEKPGPDIAIRSGFLHFYPLLPAFCRGTSTKPPTAPGRVLHRSAGTPRDNLSAVS